VDSPNIKAIFKKNAWIWIAALGVGAIAIFWPRGNGMAYHAGYPIPPQQEPAGFGEADMFAFTDALGESFGDIERGIANIFEQQRALTDTRHAQLLTEIRATSQLQANRFDTQERFVPHVQRLAPPFRTQTVSVEPPLLSGATLGTIGAAQFQQ